MGTLDRITPDKGTAKVAVTMAGALFFGVLAVFIALYSEGTIWRGLLWAAAWSSVGWFLGFLFGIPRYLSSDTARTPGATALERARQDLAAAVDAANQTRAKADEATQAKAAAATAAADKAKAASAAATGLTRAQEDLTAKPDDQAFKDALAAAELANTKAKNESTAAHDAAQKAKESTDAADEAAADADKAVEAAKAKEATANSIPTATPRASLTVNTNLEQISDWLTKIIVGVALVESQALLAHMHQAASFMAKSMTTANGVAAWMGSQKAVALTHAAALAAEAAASAAAPASAAAAAAAASAAASAASNAAAAQATNLAALASMESVAYAIMLYFLATGLLGSYLLTRLFLQRVLHDAVTESDI